MPPITSPEPDSLDEHNGSIGWLLLRFIICLHILPVIYAAYHLIKRGQEANQTATTLNPEDVRRIKVLKRML
ncbi:hypothetical protein SeMB42_g02729 [Synchytrium endobioticum]|uniref:Uncharacterized protein n=1 Tax=Synchytrium endobioticum TaxID=286115 RepID=A0A507CV65_9FUNG|nr:hypothetical protein SeLEV6574_g05245 [Synchytrium endobioticum]TPX49119.1 hypothetical protein SeMB42_g02729 [Synchytrium endobioticum]